MKHSVFLALIASIAIASADQSTGRCDEFTVLQAAVELGTSCDASNPTVDPQMCLQALPLSDDAQLYQECCGCSQLTCEAIAKALFAPTGGKIADMCNAMIDGSKWCATPHSFGSGSLRDCCPNACEDPCVEHARSKYGNPSVHNMCLSVASLPTSDIKSHCGEWLMSLNGNGLKVAQCCPIACRSTCDNYAANNYPDGTIDSMCSDIEANGGHTHDLCANQVAANSHMVGKDCCPDACSSPCEKFAKDNFENKSVHQMCVDIEEFGGYRHEACSRTVVGDATVGEECCVESCAPPCLSYSFDHFGGKSVEDMCAEIAIVGHTHEACPVQIGSTTHTIGKDCCVEACTSPCEDYAKKNFNGNSVHKMCLSIEGAGGHNNDACSAPVGDSTLAKECCSLACRSTCEIFAWNEFQETEVKEMCLVVFKNGGHEHEMCESKAGDHTHVLGKDCCPMECRTLCEDYAFDHFDGGGVHEMCLAIEDNSHWVCDADLGGGQTGKDCCPVGCRISCENHAVQHFGKGSVDEMCDEIKNNGGSEHESCGVLEGEKSPAFGTDCCPLACRTACEVYANDNFDNQNVGGMCESIAANGRHQNPACRGAIKDSTVGEECCRDECDRNPCEHYASDAFQVDSVPDMCKAIQQAGGSENPACSADVGDYKVGEACCADVCRSPCEQHAFDNYNGASVDDMCVRIEDAGGYKSDGCSGAVGDSTVAKECCVNSCFKPCEQHAYEFFENAGVDGMCQAILDGGGHDNQACGDYIFGENGDSSIGEECCPNACRTACEAYAADTFGSASVDDMCSAIETDGGFKNSHCLAQIGDGLLKDKCCVESCHSSCVKYAFVNYKAATVDRMCAQLAANKVFCKDVLDESTVGEMCCPIDCADPDDSSRRRGLRQMVRSFF